MPRPCGGCGRRSASSSGVSPVVSNASQVAVLAQDADGGVAGVQERRQLDGDALDQAGSSSRASLSAVVAA